MLPSIGQIAHELEAGSTTARALTERCFAAIEDPSGEGPRAFLHTDPQRSRAEAEASDTLRAAGIAPSPLSGVPISIKDLFDVMGQVTRAGSKALVGDSAPAQRDAPAIARLRAAGAVFVGRTNMTEFAYSGIGLNPHYGTPANPHERDIGRIPGGSSSGAAVSITDGMAAGAIGTDTGGSCRIPAAFCALVGFKPTGSRIPLDGCIPLSPSLDSIGAIASDVAGVALLDAVMAGEQPAPLAPARLDGLRIAVPTTLVLDDMEEAVARALEAALSRLSSAGARVEEIALRSYARLPELAERGGLTAAESYFWHRPLITARGDLYDPRVRARIMLGKELSAADYQHLLAVRRELIALADSELSGFDVVAAPTVPITAPAFTDLEDDGEFTRLNRLVLRNPSVANLLDRCAVSLPIRTAGTLPVGIGLMAPRLQDRRLLAIAAAMEPVLSGGA